MYTEVIQPGRQDPDSTSTRRPSIHSKQAAFNRHSNNCTSHRVTKRDDFLQATTHSSVDKALYNKGICTLSILLHCRLNSFQTKSVKVQRKSSRQQWIAAVALHSRGWITDDGLIQEKFQHNWYFIYIMQTEILATPLYKIFVSSALVRVVQSIRGKCFNPTPSSFLHKWTRCNSTVRLLNNGCIFRYFYNSKAPMWNISSEKLSGQIWQLRMSAEQTLSLSLIHAYKDFQFYL